MTTTFGAIAIAIFVVGLLIALRFFRTESRIRLSERFGRDRLVGPSDTDQQRQLMLIHDARSSLLAMEGAISAMGEEPALDSPTSDVTAGLRSEATRLRRLMDNPDGRHDPTMVSVADLLAPMVALRTAAGARVLLDVPADLVACLEGDLLQRAISNLVDNATKHAPRTATVVSARREDDILTVSVSDRGAGVPRKLRRQIFDAGVTTSAGDGLGLAICRSAVYALGGQVTYRDNPGGGAQFVIAVPAGETNVIDLRNSKRRSSPDPSRRTTPLDRRVHETTWGTA